MQLVGVVQATAFSWLGLAPAGVGVGTMLHAVPFHLSASVCMTPELFVYSPAAMQKASDTHFTPRSSGFGPLVVGLGVGWICQLVPSQCSASVPAALRSQKFPVAVQSLADMHDTASSVLK